MSISPNQHKSVDERAAAHLQRSADVAAHLSNAIRAICAGDDPAFDHANAAYGDAWGADPWAAFAGAAMVAATTSRNLLLGNAERLVKAYDLGGVDDLCVPTRWTSAAVARFSAYSHGGSLGLAKFDGNPEAWWDVAAVMSSLTTGLVLAVSADTQTPPGEVAGQVFRLLSCVRTQGLVEEQRTTVVPGCETTAPVVLRL